MMIKTINQLIKGVLIFVCVNCVFFVYYFKPDMNLLVKENRQVLVENYNKSGFEKYTTVKGLLVQISDTNMILNATDSSAKNSTSNCMVLKPTCRCMDFMQIVLCHDNGKYVSYIQNLKSKIKSNLDQVELSKSRFTCGLYNLLKRGPNQKVVAYSLYGSHLRFYKKLKVISQQIKQFYPDWIVRIYYDNSIDIQLACKEQCLTYDSNIDFCDINQLHMSVEDYLSERSFDGDYLHAMQWRWLPFGDDFVDVFSSRDMDSFVIDREVEAVDAWLQSGLYGHLMRDNPFQGAIMTGGLFDVNNSIDRNLSAEIFERIIDPTIAVAYNLNRTSRRGEDQHFLAKHVYPLIRNVSMYHDSFRCNETGGVPWPSKRKGNCFVGSSLRCDPLLRPLDQDHAPSCPIECRPADHLDWSRC